MDDAQFLQLAVQAGFGPRWAERYRGLMFRYAALVRAAALDEAAAICHRYAMDQRINRLASRGGLDCERAIRSAKG